jgi:NAD-dependent deacetylase
MEAEIVLEVMGEGGKYTLYGESTTSGWSFYVNKNESVVADLLEEDDADLRNLLNYRSDTFHSIEDALNHMGKGWSHLIPNNVHPLFSHTIWTVVKEREKANPLSLRRWVTKTQTENPIHQAAEIIKTANRMVILTGAGMSTQSGIPDFRSRNGWWRNIDPRSVATVEALEENYDLFHEFYVTRIRDLETVRPHWGHEVLKRWVEEGRVGLIATQNVDGLHQFSGIRHVEELHGSIRTYRCHTCKRPAKQESFLNKKNCECGGKLRPDVVLFGELLPENVWNQTLQSIKEADAVLVIGTSLQVYPVNQLPFLTNGKLILINAEMTGEEKRFDVAIQAKAMESLKAIQKWMKWSDSFGD